LSGASWLGLLPWSLLLVLACAGAEAPTRMPPPRAAPVTNGLEAGARAIEVAGQGLELLLPDAASWRHDAREARSWVVTHAPTRSRLVARAWRADELVHVADCEQQMRVWRPDWPTIAAIDRLETRGLTVAGDYAAELWSAVTTGRDGALVGLAQLSASDGRQCLCLAYSTSAEGPLAARVIGERLGVMTRLAFERVRRLDISERVVVPRR
jgi:hypothetical protein